MTVLLSDAIALTAICHTHSLTQENDKNVVRSASGKYLAFAAADRSKCIISERQARQQLGFLGAVPL